MMNKININSKNKKLKSILLYTMKLLILILQYLIQ